jgi:adenine/guanine phosphoribosyltransferase-like PRPP-binding protein
MIDSALGAGGHFVRLSGRIHEACDAVIAPRATGLALGACVARDVSGGY